MMEEYDFINYAEIDRQRKKDLLERVVAIVGEQARHETIFASIEKLVDIIEKYEGENE